MKVMTQLENIIMNRTVCNRTTANLIANDILNVCERTLHTDIKQENAKEIFAEIDKLLSVDKNGEANLDVTELHNLEIKYTNQ